MLRKIPTDGFGGAVHQPRRRRRSGCAGRSSRSTVLWHDEDRAVNPFSDLVEVDGSGLQVSETVIFARKLKPSYGNGTGSAAPPHLPHIA
jgi:hypothetical protein